MRSDMGYVLKTGAIIGALVGTLATILAVGTIWFADAKAGTDNVAKLAAPIALVCLGGSTVSVMLLYAVRYGRVALAPVLQQNQGGEDLMEWWAEETQEAWEDEPAEPPVVAEVQGSVRVRAIAECIEQQLTIHYREKQSPTRKLFEKYDTPQPVWNSARGVLARAGFVEGQVWASLSWETIEGILARMRVEDKRLWMPPATGRGLISASFSDRLQAGNTYLTPLPH